MSLKEKLEAVAANSAERIPPEARALMRRATEDLRRSGILDRVSKPGEPAPAFELPNVAGELVSSRRLLEGGPLVVSFYRGIW